MSRLTSLLNPRNLVIAVLALAVVGLGVWVYILNNPGLPKPILVFDVVHLDNHDWTEEERQWYYHASQGSQLMPYEWFVSLEQPQNAESFLEPAHISEFRVLPDPDPLYNEYRLPIGFAIDPPDPVTGIENVGITCAACHTSQLNYKGLGIRIDGGTGMLNVNKFLERMILALIETEADRAKFDRFAARVLEFPRYQEAGTTPEALRREVLHYIEGQARGLISQAVADRHLEMKSTPQGNGRIDALGAGGNALYGKLSPDGHVPNVANLRTLDAPVTVLPLWYTHQYDWVQTNGALAQPLARNMIEALAVNSSLVLPGDPDATGTDPTRRYLSSVRLDNMFWMENLASRIRAPEWPGHLLGPVDSVKAAQGAALYQQLCQGCHEPELGPPNRFGKRYWQLKFYPVDEEAARADPTLQPTVIGTDPLDAVNFADRRLDASALWPDSTDVPGALVISDVLNGIQRVWFENHGIDSARQVVMQGFRDNALQAPKGYPARPLAGIWAAAPYLHNNAVPTLYELLSPVDERSTTFYTGDLEFDPVNVGYLTEAFEGGFEVDTRLPGNSNAGHEFADADRPGVIGRLLTEDERYALIEYLKALRFPEGDARIDSLDANHYDTGWKDAGGYGAAPRDAGG